MGTKYAKTRGTTDDPVRRQNDRHDQLCAYNGCLNVGTFRRLTNGGMAVLYCSAHYNQAFATFSGGASHGD